MYSMVKSIRGKCYTEVVRFSEGPLLEVLLYKVVCHVSSSTTVSEAESAVTGQKVIFHTAGMMNDRCRKHSPSFNYHQCGKGGIFLFVSTRG